MTPHESVPWYFPGDVPFSDVALPLLLVAGLVCLFFSAVYIVWLRRRRVSGKKPGGWVLMVLAGGLCFLLNAVTIPPLFHCMAVLGHRHVGEWGRLRQRLLYHRDVVTRHTRSLGLKPSDSLSPRQFEDLRRALTDLPEEFTFTDLAKPVRIRLAMTCDPYLYVDFGEGANAAFDPITMICLYSD